VVAAAAAPMAQVGVALWGLREEEIASTGYITITIIGPKWMIN
jgi:hypothetical protein